MTLPGKNKIKDGYRVGRKHLRFEDFQTREIVANELYWRLMLALAAIQANKDPRMYSGSDMQMFYQVADQTRTKLGVQKQLWGFDFEVDQFVEISSELLYRLGVELSLISNDEDAALMQFATRQDGIGFMWEQSIAKCAQKRTAVKRSFADALEELNEEYNQRARRSKLDPVDTVVLLDWFLKHLDRPYPKAADKDKFASATKLSDVQIRNWFTNIRKRHYNPLKQGHSPKCKLDVVILSHFKGKPTFIVPPDLNDDSLFEGPPPSPQRGLRRSKRRRVTRAAATRPRSPTMNAVPPEDPPPPMIPSEAYILSSPMDVEPPPQPPSPMEPPSPMDAVPAAESVFLHGNAANSLTTMEQLHAPMTEEEMIMLQMRDWLSTDPSTMPPVQDVPGTMMEDFANCPEEPPMFEGEWGLLDDDMEVYI